MTLLVGRHIVGEKVSLEDDMIVPCEAPNHSTLESRHCHHEVRHSAGWR